MRVIDTFSLECSHGAKGKRPWNKVAPKELGKNEPKKREKRLPKKETGKLISFPLPLSHQPTCIEDKKTIHFDFNSSY